MTRVLTGSVGLLSSIRYCIGVFASGVVGVCGRMTVDRVELRPEIGMCASSMVTASTEACESGSFVPDVRGGGGGFESARSL